MTLLCMSDVLWGKWLFVLCIKLYWTYKTYSLILNIWAISQFSKSQRLNQSRQMAHCRSGHENSIRTQKSCWTAEQNPEHSKQLSASFHHHAATNQVTALKSISFTLYWRYLRYSVCLPKENLMGKKWFPLEIRLQSHSYFLLWNTLLVTSVSLTTPTVAA